MINEDPDIVSICTPPEYHLDHMKTVLDKGKAVFCEKLSFGINQSTIKRLIMVSRLLENIQTQYCT